MATTVCATRSATVGMPNLLSFPDDPFGIITCRTATGPNSPDFSDSRMASRDAPTPTRASIQAPGGELRRGLPVGLVWGEADGEILQHPDEAVTGVIAAVFDRFAVCGSVRATWLWLREQGLRWPLQPVAYPRGGGLPEITWV